MHPVIRVLAFLFLVALLSRASLTFILLLDALFCALSLPYLRELGVGIWRALRRLRWLWLSLLLLYAWLPPATTGDERTWVLHLSGLWLGLERCLALLTVVLYFSLLNHVTRREELQAALHWLLRPFEYLGMPAARLSLRIALSLEAVARLQASLASQQAGQAPAARDWRQLPQRIEKLFVDALAEADRQDTQRSITLELTAPGVGQWLSLCVLVILLFAGLTLFSA